MGKTVRLGILSDLHLELAQFHAPVRNSDVVILAGDIHHGTAGVEWAMETFPQQPVVYVPGNHEYYGNNLPGLYEGMKAGAAGTRVFVLDRDEVVLCGVLFLGATLWTDYRLGGSLGGAMRDAPELMNDYRKIRVAPSFRRVRPEDLAAEHAASRLWLTNRLAAVTHERVVVVTHHAPSSRSLAPGQYGSRFAPLYASDLECLMDEHRPHLWIHGHTHAAVDYKIGSTRVISNPRGYVPMQSVQGFDPGFTVEI